MHNGMVFPIVDDLISNNKGIIAPNKTLFPDNARGTKTITVNGHQIHLIINGGITKLQESARFLGNFNGFYPMSIDKVDVNVRSLKNSFFFVCDIILIFFIMYANIFVVMGESMEKYLMKNL